LYNYSKCCISRKRSGGDEKAAVLPLFKQYYLDNSAAQCDLAAAPPERILYLASAQPALAGRPLSVREIIDI
jgi:hypothetical protein